MKKIQPEPMMNDSISSMLPSFSLTVNNLPAIKNWQVGKKYNLELEVEQVSMSKDEYGTSPLTARFRIHKVGEKELMDEDDKKGRMGHY